MTARPRSLLPEPVGRRLTLTPIGLDVVIALAHDPEGIRLSALAHIIDAPISSVQAALRSLMASHLLVRDQRSPPTYSLADHPARDALIALALLLPEPIHVLSVVLRASPAVIYAAVDRQGFVAALDPASHDGALERLRTSLAEVAAGRAEVPPVTVSARQDLERLLGVSVGSRDRLASAATLKGTVPGGRRPPHEAADPVTPRV